MGQDAVAERQIFLSTVPAGARERRLALAAGLAFALVFLALAPFASRPLPQVWGFIPAYESALAISDLITTVLLFSQFAILRSRALLVLAAGYLFCAAMAVAHALSFPGLFSPTGLLGAGAQTTAWLYMFWHAGFPLALIAATLMKDGAGSGRAPRVDIIAAVLAVAGLVAALVVFAGVRQDLLPAIMQGSHHTSVYPGVVATVWGLSLVALVVLWLRRPHSVLDVWLMIVMYAWLADVGVSAVLSAGRFDLGFYFGRIFGLMAASFVLLGLLLETGALYARLARRAAEEFQQKELEIARARAEKEAAEARANLAEQLEARNRELAVAYRELQHTQAQLVHTAKMASLGGLVAGVAHEINNPLGFLASHLGTVTRGLESMVPEIEPHLSLASRRVLGKLRERLKDMRLGFERVGDLVVKLRTFSRLDESEVKHVKIEDNIESVLTLLQHKLKDGITIERQYGEINAISCYPGPLNQVIMNLVSNAIDAIEGEGRITIATGGFDSTFVLSVADTGKGIPAAIRDRVFEPFFTTKPVGAGTGLGLSISYGIIQRHNGTLEFESEEGKGTKFTISIPTDQEAQRRSA
ncbi:MAG TPA: MASE4 domain-containing protein [Alphaproteobacteria bacterium]|nr:MASE4 domain-containing protein [Alphaproteobacteria bacterium]